MRLIKIAEFEEKFKIKIGNKIHSGQSKIKFLNENKEVEFYFESIDELGNYIRDREENKIILTKSRYITNYVAYLGIFSFICFTIGVFNLDLLMNFLLIGLLASFVVLFSSILYRGIKSYRSERSENS